MIPPDEPEPSGEPPATGEEQPFKIPVEFGTETITAQVAEVGHTAVVWLDVTPEHTAEMSDDFIAEFLGDFDAVIMPRARTIFGTESDVDGTGRIALLFSPLTYESAVAFFSSCDLKLVPGCAGGNGSEVLYLTPPNAIGPPYNTPNAMKEILCHELQHLINFNRKVLRNDLSFPSDNAYVLEGLGALAQDVLGYQAGNFYVTKAGLDEIDRFSLGDILVDLGEYDYARDGALRGGAYLFIRWLYDRAGGDEALPDGTVVSRGGPALVRTLMEAPESVATVLPEVTGASLTDLAMDFYSAVGLSNRDQVAEAAAANPCFRYLPVVADPITDRQRGANLFTTFHGQSMAGPAVQPAASPDGRVNAGGVEYLRLEAEAGSPGLSFTVAVDPDAQARLRVFRIR